MPLGSKTLADGTAERERERERDRMLRVVTLKSIAPVNMRMLKAFLNVTSITNKEV